MSEGAENWGKTQQCLVLRGRSKRGAPPAADTAECAPPFTRQPNLNLTMEPAQYAWNPSNGPGNAQLLETLRLAQSSISVGDRRALEKVWRMFKAHRLHMESEPEEAKDIESPCLSRPLPSPLRQLGLETGWRSYQSVYALTLEWNMSWWLYSWKCLRCKNSFYRSSLLHPANPALLHRA